MLRVRKNDSRNTQTRTEALSKVCILGNSFENGLTSPDASQTGSVCDIDFLKAIIGNLELISFLCSMNKAHGVTEIEEILAATKVELKRLKKHPELYPNKTIEQDFLRCVRRSCGGMPKVVQAHKVIKRARKDWSKFLDKYNQEKVLPNRDEHRTLWQQFLHDQAPGRGARRSAKTGEGCVYLVPEGGIRFLKAMHGECRSIVRHMQAVGRTSRPHLILIR